MKKSKLIGTLIAVGAAGILLAACGSNAAKSSSSSKSSDAASSMTKTVDTAAFTGSLKGDNKMKVSGNVSIKDGKLTLTDFSTAAGPDLHIYLSKDGSVDNGAINLGKISLTDANQKIKLPAGTNISDFKQVLIHCDEAHVTFGAADVK